MGFDTPGGGTAEIPDDLTVNSADIEGRLDVETAVISDSFQAPNMLSLRYRSSGSQSVSGGGETVINADTTQNQSAVTFDDTVPEFESVEDRTCFIMARCRIDNYSDGDRFGLQLYNKTSGSPFQQSFRTLAGTGGGTDNRDVINLMYIRTVETGNTFDFRVQAFDGGANIVNAQCNLHEIFIGGLNQPAP